MYTWCLYTEMMQIADSRLFGFLLVIIVCISNDGANGIRHARNLIWTQTPTMRKGVSRIVGIEGDPSDWVPNGNVKIRHISAPHVGWQFKALSYNHATKTLYWTEATNKKIQGLRLNGTTETETIFVGTSTMAEGLAVDWLSNNIYWSDSLYRWILLAPLGTKDSVYKLIVRTGMSNPHSLAVHPQKGYLFWTDNGDTSKIEVSDLLGQNRRTIVDADIESPRGITIDYAENLLYWVDSHKDTIESAEFNGNNRRVVAFQSGTLFFGISVFQDYLFVTEQTQGHLRVYDKKKGDNVINYQLGYIPDGITMYDDTMQEGNSSVCDAAGCDHICVLDPLAGPICRCGEGYILQDDGLSCALSKKFGTPSHIYSIGDAICQYPVNLPDMQLFNVSLESQCFLQNGRGYFGLTFDAREHTLYYSENVTKSIGRISLQVGEVGEAIIKGVGEIQGMAYDWVAGNLFWTDVTYGHISMARKDGMHPTVLVEGLDNPLGIVVYPARGEMYWTELGRQPMISAASMDGSNRRPLVNISMVGVPNHLYLDYTNDRLYWADSALFSIRCVDLNTLAVDIIYDDIARQVTFFGVSMYQGYVLWTDKDSLKNGIHMARLDKQEKVRGILHPHAGIASDLITFDPENQPEQDSPCSSPVKLCDHVCIPTSNATYLCSCGIGYELDEDFKSCFSKIKSDNFLLTVDSYQKQIYQIGVEKGDISAIPLAKAYKGVAIDYDPITSKLYWTDNRLNVIMVSALDGFGESVFFKLDNNSISDGIAVDYINSLLFFTCTGNNVIVVVSLKEPSIYRTIVNDSLDQPRDIIVHPEKGKIYWTDWGVEPKIEMATMAGEDREVLIRLQNDSWPNALAHDVKGNALYWLDAKTDQIELLRLDTMERKIVFKATGAHFFGLALMGQYLYVTDWMDRHISRINLENGTSQQFGPSKFARLNGIVGYNKSEVRTYATKCLTSTCSNLCLPVSADNYKCACADDGKFAKIPCRELNDIDTDISILSRQTQNSESSPATAIGLSVMAVVIVLVLVVAAVYVYNKRCRTGDIAHNRLVEETSKVDAFYRITFPDPNTDEPNFDSGIENPSFSCSTEDVQTSGDMVRFSPL